MRKDEVIIRIVGKLDLVYGDVINQQDVKLILEEVLYDYDVKPKETALVPLNNMKDMIMLYLTSKKIEGLSDKTIENYGRNLFKFSNDIMKNVEDITAMDIRMHLANYAKTGVKNTTIATRTDILRGFFGWLQNEEYIAKNPMNKVKTIKAESRERKPLTYEEMEILRRGCKTLRQKSLLEVLYSSCVRLEELVNINISDIKWHENEFSVIGKGNKQRTVYFNTRAKIYLQEYLNSRDDNSPALFVTERVPIKRLERRGVQREIKKIQKQSGIRTNVFVHKLRHTGATHMAQKGIPIEIISKFLGHDSIETTKIYVKTSQSSIQHEYKKHMAS